MVIHLEGVTKRYGRVKALDAVTLDIYGGQIIAVLGPNGAGKTTLLRCLSTIASPSKGQILWDGEPLRRDRLDLRRRMMFLVDFPPLFGEMTIIQHVAMIMNVYGVASAGREAEVVQVLRDLDLLTLCDTLIGRLSRGQAYKTAFAGMVLVNPDLWLVDEPFASGMDPNGIFYFKKKARAAAAAGKLVIYSTQIIDIAESFSDRVCVIHRGEVRAFDSVSMLAGAADVRPESGVLEEVLQKLREEDR